MSDPVTNVEIEDVLSSIRRLVSEDARPKPVTRPAKPACLVLTPAQRVPDAELPGPAVTAPVARLVASAPVELPASAMVVPEPANPEPVAPAVVTPEPEPERAAVEPEADDSLADGGLARKIAELEAMIARSTGDFEAELPGEGENAAIEEPLPEVLEWEDCMSALAEPDPAAPVPLLLRTRSEAEPAPQAVEPREETPDLVAPTEPAIDEDMLRDMVSEIVRQELQGVLGERITRNVRKLVRREIHRVLMSQEFD